MVPPVPAVPDQLVAELAAANAARRAGTACACRHDAGASRRLAAYGSLVPGECNHGLIAAVGGTWRAAFVRGWLQGADWRQTGGYPTFRWDEAAPPVPVQVLTADALPEHWPRLDRFEGAAYARVLVPAVLADGGGIVVANLYEAA